MKDPDLHDLVTLCLESAADAPDGVVVPEPYAPFIPDPWNGVLLLAEAQNLSSPTGTYVTALKAMSRRELALRLYPAHRPERARVGVGPWDAGVLKVALAAAAPGIRLEQVAVGNAVPWSRAKGVKNLNPTRDDEEIAATFWRELLAKLPQRPTVVVSVGAVARRVMKGAGVPKEANLRLTSSSPVLIRRARAMFHVPDLTARYPEIEAAFAAVPESNAGDEDQAFYACHAVSMAKRFKTPIPLAAEPATPVPA